ncbi:MAG: SDR family NAD(P)-dependent oxidoreductase [Bacteroidia bacterium]|nr:SDR family NAD(P)-dependent oxidoreductase [Bacteroidia bacterium]
MKSHYCLITGASQGLGKAISFELAMRKWNLILVALPNSGLENLANYIKKAYKVSVVYIAADLSSRSGSELVVDFINQNQLNLKFLVNNAGVLSRGLFKDQNVDYYMNQINVNVLAPTYLSRELLPNLKLNAPSGILNVSSMASFFPLPLKQVYCGTKSYLSTFSRSLRIELKKEEVTVSLLCPGSINTTTRICLQNRSLGWLDRKSVLNPEKVAKLAVEGMLRGKEIITPGFINKLFLVLDKILPKWLKNMLIMKELNHLQNIGKFINDEKQKIQLKNI